jgi:transketolase
VASGSLGQGLSVALGAALTKKMNQDSGLVYVLHGDGELQEGQVWEAAMFAAHNKVDNVIAFVDVNGQQIDGPTDRVLSLGNLASKWEAFGWEVLQTDGNDLSTLNATIHEAKEKMGQGRPVVILMKTVMGKGVDFMEGTHKWHGVAPNDVELSNALAQLEETLGDY